MPSKPAKPTSKPAKPTSKPATPTSKPATPTSKPAKPTSRSRNATAKPGHDAIAHRAYEISQTEPTGDPVSDWLKAEHELTPQPRPRRTRAQ
jgi:hypothetical protein